MQTVKESLKLVFYVAGIVLVCALTHLVVSVTRDVHQTADQYQHVGTELDLTVRMARLNLLDPKNGIAPTLEETRKTVRAYRTLADDLHKTSIRERDAVEQAGDEFVKFSQNMNRVAVSVDRETTAVGLASVEAFNSIIPTMQQAQFTFGAIQRDSDDLDARIKDPKIDLMLSDVERVTHNAALATTDGQVYLHGALFPTKKHGWARVGSYAETTGKTTYAVCRIMGYCLF